MYTFAAHLTATLHVFYVVSLIALTAASFTGTHFIIPLLVLLAIGTIGQIICRGTCVVTSLENYFRHKSPTLRPYDQPFIVQYGNYLPGLNLSFRYYQISLVSLGAIGYGRIIHHFFF